MTLDDHPSLDRVLLAREGELPAEQAREILRHVDGCHSCRADLNEFASVVEVANRRNVAADRDLLEFDAHLRGLGSPKGRRRVTRHVIAAAAAVLAFVLALPWLRAPHGDVLVAAELLDTLSRREPTGAPSGRVVVHSAVALEPTEPSRAHIAAGPCAGSKAAAVRVVSVIRIEPPLSADIKALLESHCFDAERPLSVAGYRQWYAALGRKSDQVNADDERASITVRTAEGAIHQATLVVNLQTAVPTALDLALSDGMSVRFGLSTTEPHAEPAPVPSTAIASTNRSTSRKTSAIQVPTPDQRVQLLSLLHTSSLDLGSTDLRRSASSGQVHVRLGAEQNGASAQELARQIAQIPGVSLHVMGEAGALKIPGTPDEVLSPARALADEQIQRHVSDPAAQQFLRDRAFGAIRTLASRTNAIAAARALLPERDVASLSSSSRARWREIVTSHGRHALTSLNELQAGLSDLGLSLSSSIDSRVDCQSVELNTLARKVQVVTAALVGGLASTHEEPTVRDRDAATGELARELQILRTCLARDVDGIRH